MRKIILGAIGVVWGGGVLLASWLRGGPSGQGAYGAGQVVGLIFGVLLLVAGAYALVTGLQDRQATPPPKKKKRKRRPVEDDE
jgi:hypothetical protein